MDVEETETMESLRESLSKAEKEIERMNRQLERACDDLAWAKHLIRKGDMEGLKTHFG